MKQKHWEVSVFDNTSKTIRNDALYTTDTEVYLVFELIDEGFTPDTATVTIYNIYGTATVNENVDIVNGIVNYEMPIDTIGHQGGWRTQVVFTKDNEDYTTTVIEFDVDGHLLDNNKPTIVYIDNWNSFIKHGENLVDGWEQLEKIRQANERKRESAESVRQKTFETNEVERESTFEVSESTRQANELIREEAESVRVANEAERISKDNGRDGRIEAVEGVVEDVSGKIDSKANKYMLLSPKYDLVYDSCVRHVDTPLDAYSVPMESGHYFENVEDRDSDTTLTYEPDGVLLAGPASRNVFSPVLIENFNVDFPYFDVRVRNLSITHDARFWFIKYKDKDNWVAIRIHALYQQLTVIASVDAIQTDIAVENIGSSTSEHQARPETIYSLKAEIVEVHQNFSESRRTLRVFKNGQRLFTVPIPTNAVSFPNRIGFSVGGHTEILNFKAGRSR